MSNVAKVIRRSVDVVAALNKLREKEKLKNISRDLNDGPEENVFREGSKQPGAKPGGGSYYRGLGGFDESLLVKR